MAGKPLFFGHGKSWQVSGQHHRRATAEETLQEQMLMGRRQYVGSLERSGEVVDYYRLEKDGHVTYVYNVRE